MISWVAVLEMGVIVVAATIAKFKKRMKSPLWQLLLGWGGVSAFLLFPISLVFWIVLPKMQFMQFPWRWLLCLSTPTPPSPRAPLRAVSRASSPSRPGGCYRASTLGAGPATS